MKFLGIDPNTPSNGSPTIWEDGDDYVIQGWKITDDETMTAILATGPIPDHETVLRLPKRMMQFFPEVANG